MWVALLLAVVTRYTDGYVFLYWAGYVWPLVLVLWLVLLLALTALRAIRGAGSVGLR
jgi:hypothetical protein